MNRIIQLFFALILLFSFFSSAFADQNIDACFNYLKASDYPRAIESGKKAIKSAPKFIDSHYCLGEAYRRKGELKLALQEMRQAEQLANQKKDLADIYNRLGMILGDIGDSEQALQEYNRFMSLSRELGNKDDEAAALNNIAGIYDTRGQLDQALEYYQKSLTLTSNERGKSSTYNNMALVYGAKGDYPKAVDYLKQAIVIAERYGNYHGQAQYLINLGSIQRQMRIFSGASDSLFQGLEKIRKVKDSYWEGVAHQYIGRLYEDMGNTPLARKWLKAALDIYTRIGATSNAQNIQVSLSRLLQPRPYGGIEIGAKGVKAIVLVMTPRADEGYSVNEPFRRSINTTIISGVKEKGVFDPQAIDETAKAVKELFDLIVSQYKVDKGNIYLVGSSAVAKVNNRDQLAARVKDLTGQLPDFITKEDEVLYNLVGSVPSDKSTKALSVDIGSGNTKIGYWDKANGKNTVVAVEIPLGTVTLADSVAKAGDDSRVQSNAADIIIKKEFSQRLTQEMQKRPGYRNRRPVYLVGGIVWAVATLTKPGNYEDFVKFTPADVDAFIAGLKKTPDTSLNPSLAHIKDTETRKWAEGQITALKDVFTPENMLSGAKLLKATFSDMKIKEAYFARWGSWLAGRVYLQAYDAEEQAAKYQ